jgi:fructoselysine and glucoselysine-specific PTS system IID component
MESPMLKVIAAGMGIYFAQQGSLLGPILALLVYNLPHLSTIDAI